MNSESARILNRLRLERLGQEGPYPFLLGERLRGSPHRVAINAKGNPLFLFALTAPIRSRTIELSLVTIMTNVMAKVRTAQGEEHSSRVALVECRSEREDIQAYFLAVGEALADRLLQDPPPALDEEFESLRDLFASAARPPRKSVAGLWAELFVVSRSTDPGTLLMAWHADPTDRYDFAGDGWRLEVKSFEGRLRQHFFSHRQLWPPEGISVVVASVPIERSQGGMSVPDLLERISLRLSSRPDLVLKLRGVTIATLGNAIFDDPSKFDEAVSRDGLQCLALESLPRLQRVLPDGIVDAHLLVDVGEAPPLTDVLGGLLSP